MGAGKILLGAALILSAACGSDKKKSTINDEGLSYFSPDSVRKYLSVLADDSLLGRMPFTEGETRTISYLEGQFKNLGLEPGNGDSYMQDVPMVNILATAAPSMMVQSAKKTFSLKAYDEYVIWTDKTDSFISLDTAELVFAGFGVVAPEHNWNDYEGLDVKGKVVLVMVNDPGFWTGDTTLFKGKEMTYYGRWTYKYEEAARQGAKGCIIIHNTAAASYPFIVQQNGFNSDRLQLDERGKNIKHSDVIGWISEPATNRLFREAGFDSTLLTQANKRGFKAVPLNLKVSTTMKVKSTYSKSHNVVAKITGTKRPDEVIIYTAHWDHFGVGTPDEQGDSIYNGALDNASGTAGLLELARVFKNLKEKPERTVVFLAVTAEEQGLWGSAYYTMNPIYPLNKTVANINMDVLSPSEVSKDVIIIGKGQSDLEDYLKTEAEKQGRVVTFEPHPEAGYYYRSDHFNFAKVGVPALYTERGMDIPGKEPGYGEKQQAEYTEKHYHRPSDEYDPATFSMAGGIADLKLFFQVGKKLAFETEFVQWKDGSEFKKLRK
ncbi:MAG: M20/M25/M40 family metallo-hydrolase [Chitinophagaceae bacterium]|nr:MAG: M20/M25/M40 family metallo-hydrolase [Chitinophagaceae bacterium]